MEITANYGSMIYHNQSNGYTIAVYYSREADKIPCAASRNRDRKGTFFTAVGTELPCIEDVDIRIEGEWKDTEKYGKQFVVDWYQIILPKTRDGMIAYLSSGLIKGIGSVTARRIVDRFQDETFQVLENNPERLTEIKALNAQKIEEISEMFRASSQIRELAAYLAPFHVTLKKAEKIQEYFGAEASRIVREHPYRLCEIKGFGFLTVDPIARSSKGFTPDAWERIKAGIEYVLKAAEKEGHLYLESKDVIDRSYQLLNKGFEEERVSKNLVMKAGNEMVITDKILQSDSVIDEAGQYKTLIFLKANRNDEIHAVKDIFRILDAAVPAIDVSQELEEAQAEFGIILAEKQKEAVRMVFQSPFSIITGGPGKGKTMNLKVILKVFEMVEEKKEALLCAPTGRARKRLSESTGYPALTIHKALYLTDDEITNLENDEVLNEDFIIVDEFTMADMRLSRILFSRIKTGARVILVGDVDQLPSVGPGNVFKELIESGIIPVTVLDVFFRQEKDSRIILNADRINRNQKNLLFGDDFQFIEAQSPEEAAERINHIYEAELSDNGNDPEAVQVLTPLRVNTKAGVVSMNASLREIANPGSMKKAELKTASCILRVGDKVMQTKNTEELSNGDIGSVKKILRSADGTVTVTAEFGEVSKNYQEEELSDLEHAYAMSIHKSQGAEYPVVIIPVLSCFYPMLKRNVYYTGVTRARKRVYLVGSKKALYIAISNNDSGKRNTLLSYRLKREAKRRLEHATMRAA